MGIVISYRGTIDELSSIDGLIADVRQFCQKIGWEFIEVADPWDAQNFIRGFLREGLAESTKEVAHG